MDLELINLFFNFNEKKEYLNEDENQGNPSRLKLVHDDIITYHLEDPKLEGLQSILKNVLKSEILTKEKNKIKTSFKDLFCENKRKFNIGEQLLKFHLDIKVILKQLLDLEKIKSLLYGKNELKVFKLLMNKIIFDPNFKENFMTENFLFQNKDDKLENVVESFANFILQRKNKKLEKKFLKNFKINFK